MSDADIEAPEPTNTALTTRAWVYQIDTTQQFTQLGPRDRAVLSSASLIAAELMFAVERLRDGHVAHLTFERYCELHGELWTLLTGFDSIDSRSELEQTLLYQDALTASKWAQRETPSDERVGEALH